MADTARRAPARGDVGAAVPETDAHSGLSRRRFIGYLIAGPTLLAGLASMLNPTGFHMGASPFQLLKLRIRL